jgi:hypothetical protein
MELAKEHMVVYWMILAAFTIKIIAKLPQILSNNIQFFPKQLSPVAKLIPIFDPVMCVLTPVQGV